MEWITEISYDYFIIYKELIKKSFDVTGLKMESENLSTQNHYEKKSY